MEKEDFQRWTYWDLYFLKFDPLGVEELINFRENL